MLRLRDALLGSSYIRERPLLRKSAQVFAMIARWRARSQSEPEDYLEAPPVLANSFPKSGTHLLLQILGALPSTTHYGLFLASMPSITYRERSESNHRKTIARIAPGELIPAHLFYSPDVAAALIELHCIHYFIIRDPREVAISEAHYLTYMNRWHRLHNHFARALGTDEERIAEAIAGVRDPDFPYDYPNIRDRFLRYQGWMEAEGVLTVRYEELRSSDLEQTIRRIAEHYQANSGIELDMERTIQEMRTAIDPQRSHTFRSGELEQWREVFTPQLKDLMKAVAGDLIIDLGYEQDKDW